MDIELRQVTQSDLDQVFHLRGVAYGPVPDRQRALATLTWRLPYALGAFAGGRLLSMSMMIPFEAYLGGRTVTIGGLSGVATAPEARRRGLVAMSLRRWFEDLHERGVGWSAEHPFDPTFYARLGYQTVPNGHTLEVPVSRLKATAGRAQAREASLLAAPVGPEATAELARVYDRYAPRFSFMLTRQDGLKDYWGWTLKRPTEDLPHFAYLAEDAYAVFTTKEHETEDDTTVLSVRDMAYASPAGRARLLALLASFEGQVETVRVHLPPGDPVAADWASWHTVPSPELQVRVVDLSAALASLPWPEATSLTLRVSDPDCPWNDGTFALELGPDGASTRRADGAEPDAAIGVGALAALLTGAAAPATLLADGRAEGSVAALARLSAPLAGHPVYKPHNDHF